MRSFPCSIILISVCTTFSAWGSLIEIDEDAGFKSGMYAAFTLGANWANADWSGISSLNAINDTGDALALFESWTPAGASNDGAKFMGSMGLGYQIVDGPLYLGIQASGTFSDARNFSDDETRSFRKEVFERQHAIIEGTAYTQSMVSLANAELDLDLKPGFIFLDNFLVYARIGAALSQLKINSATTWTATGTTYSNDPQPPIINTNQASDATQGSKNIVGFRAGVGAEYLLTDDFGISLDYIFTDYGDINTLAEGTESDPFSGNHVSGIYAPEVSVTTHAVLLGISYHL